MVHLITTSENASEFSENLIKYLNPEFAQSLCATFRGSLSCSEWLPSVHMETLNQAGEECGIAFAKK